MSRNRAVTVAVDWPRSGILSDRLAEIPVRITANQAVEVRGGRVRLVERTRVTNYHRVILFYAKGNGLWGWPVHSKDVSSAEIEGVRGALAAGGTRAGRAVIDPSGAAPASHHVRVNVQHLLVAEIDLGAMGQAAAGHHVMVLPGPSYSPGPRPSGRTESSPGAPELQLVVDPIDGGRPPHGVFRHDITGHAYLRNAGAPVPPGRLELRLQRTATWQEHLASRDRHTMVSETKDRGLLVLPTPAGDAPGDPAGDPVGVTKPLGVAFSLPTPKRRITEQTTRTTEGSLAWHLVGRWEAAGQVAESTVEIVMAMPSLLTVSKH